MYLKWHTTVVRDLSPIYITAQYDAGFVFTREEPGSMNQTRSVRIDLEQFTLTSENRRILRKTEGLTLTPTPLPFSEYHWSIGKLAKDFYDIKFGKGTFSANKIKELLTTDFHFTHMLVYQYEEAPVGYAICYENNDILHYSYPFYDLNIENKNIGMGMMLRAIQYAKESGKKFIYLGSAQRPGDTYKFQFNGMEWFDGESWQSDFKELKNVLRRT